MENTQNPHSSGKIISIIIVATRNDQKKKKKIAQERTLNIKGVGGGGESLGGRAVGEVI